MSVDKHAAALQAVHMESGRTLSQKDFDLCMRIAKQAFSMGAVSTPEDSRRLDMLETMVDNGVVTMCFEFDGGVHLTLEGVSEKPIAYRHKNSIRAALDEALDEAGSERPEANTNAGSVPANVRAALDRMCSPLDKSWLTGVTAEEDARCMKLIRDFVLASRSLPTDLTPPVRNVLSLMLWQTLPIANALRATGRHINRKTEDEQAAALHWLLGIALEHGDNWEQEAARALHKLLSEKKGV